jgi:hypothetical protein
MVNQIRPVGKRGERITQGRIMQQGQSIGRNAIALALATISQIAFVSTAIAQRSGEAGVEAASRNAEPASFDIVVTAQKREERL